MKRILVLFVLVLTSTVINSQTIYSKAFGKPIDKPLIYLHGGPGYNSVGFEITTAQKLSENGFYVIVYDRRREVRSTDKNATFTFQETFEDLNFIYKKFSLKNATLIGHSFGGVIATLYAEKYPKKIRSVLLVGAPLSIQETFLTILKTSKVIYENKNDSVNLRYIGMLENMNKNSLEYSSYCFGHAMQNGFYYPKKPTEEALSIYSKFKTNPLLIKYGSQMTYEAPKGFWKNEKYTSINLTQHIRNLQKNKINFFGVYGKDDGLFSEEQILNLENLIGKDNFEYLDNCSHTVFMDQQTQFINAINRWIK